MIPTIFLLLNLVQCQSISSIAYFNDDSCTDSQNAYSISLSPMSACSYGMPSGCVSTGCCGMPYGKYDCVKSTIDRMNQLNVAPIFKQSGFAAIVEIFNTENTCLQGDYKNLVEMFYFPPNSCNEWTSTYGIFDISGSSVTLKSCSDSSCSNCTTITYYDPTSCYGRVRYKLGAFHNDQSFSLISATQVPSFFNIAEFLSSLIQYLLIIGLSITILVITYRNRFEILSKYHSFYKEALSFIKLLLLKKRVK